MFDVIDRQSRKVAGQEEVRVSAYPNEETGITEYLVFSSEKRTKRNPHPDLHNERFFYAQADGGGHIATMWRDRPRTKQKFDAYSHLIRVYHRWNHAQRRLERESLQYLNDLKAFLGIK